MIFRIKLDENFSGKVYPFADTFLQQPTTSLLYLSPVDIFILPKTLLGDSKSFAKRPASCCVESSDFSGDCSFSSVSSQTDSTSLNKTNGKYALEGHHELAEEGTGKDGLIFICISTIV